jgi:hypothetical protein
MPVILPMMPPRLTGAAAFFVVTTVVPALASDVLLPPLACRPRAARDGAGGGGAGVRRPRAGGAAATGLAAAAALGRVGRGFSVLVPTEGAGFEGEGARVTLGLAAGAGLNGECVRVRELAFLGERTWPASSLREMALLAAVTGAAATRVRLRCTESSFVWFSLSEPMVSGPIMSALRRS